MTLVKRKLLAKIHIANMLKYIELDNNNYDHNVMSDKDFEDFNEEFIKQSNRIFNMLEKEIKMDLPNCVSLEELYQFGKTLD